MSAAANGELGKLTRGEALLLERRRLNETQRKAARRHKVPYSRYSAWERDQIQGPATRIRVAKPHERCLLYRRRAKETQETVALSVGMCRYQLNQMERGDIPCDDLLWHWEQ